MKKWKSVSRRLTPVPPEIIYTIHINAFKRNWTTLVQLDLTNLIKLKDQSNWCQICPEKWLIRRLVSASNLNIFKYFEKDKPTKN